MTAFLIPPAARAAVEGVIGPVSTTLVDASGTVTHYLANDDSNRANSAAVVAAGATAYPTASAAIAASGSKTSQVEAISATIRAAAAAAIAANQAFAQTVANRRQAIADARAQAQAGTTVTVSNIAQVQTVLRQISTQLVGIDTVIGDLSEQAAALSAQNNAVIRLVLGQLDATD